jgi:methionine-rich copper-binding protein CopC
MNQSALFVHLRTSYMAFIRNAFVLAVMVLLGLARPVWAHAILMEAVPAANQVVKGGSVPIKLRFNSRIDAKRSKLVLISPAGLERPLTIEEQPAPDTLTSKAESLAPGVYLLQWQVLATDGHITQGKTSFKAQ